jgi:hypothetical protein
MNPAAPVRKIVLLFDIDLNYVKKAKNATYSIQKKLKNRNLLDCTAESRDPLMNQTLSLGYGFAHTVIDMARRNFCLFFLHENILEI